MSLVTWGKKYKGKTWEELFQDKNYVEWCLQQPHLRPKIEIAAKSLNLMLVNQSFCDVTVPTPEHNRIQNLFLKDDFKAKFVAHWICNIMGQLPTWTPDLIALAKSELLPTDNILKVEEIDNTVELTFERTRQQSPSGVEKPLSLIFDDSKLEITATSAKLNEIPINPESILFGEYIRNKVNTNLSETKSGEIFNQEMRKELQDIEKIKTQLCFEKKEEKIKSEKESLKKQLAETRDFWKKDKDEKSERQIQTIENEYKTDIQRMKSEASQKVFNKFSHFSISQYSFSSEIYLKVLWKDDKCFAVAIKKNYSDEIKTSVIHFDTLTQDLCKLIGELPFHQIRILDGDYTITKDECKYWFYELKEIALQSIVETGKLVKFEYNHGKYFGSSIIKQRFVKQEVQNYFKDYEFESKDGTDVCIDIGRKEVHSEADRVLKNAKYGPCRFRVNIEIKPLLGDDYPAVLRTIKQRKETKLKEYWVLLVETFQAEHVSWEELKQIFIRENIFVMSLEEIQNVDVNSEELYSIVALTKSQLESLKRLSDFDLSNQIISYKKTKY